jgi:hypothetical protein
MVNQSYCSPKLLINGIPYNTMSSFQLKFPGSSQINSLGFSLSSLDIKEQALYGKPVELFLNYGSEDGTPIFRGVIRDISPTTKGIKFSALDSRSLMAGTNAAPLNITDNNNYDGYTLGQFLQKIIQEDYMNYDYVDDLAAGAETTETIATGDGVQADATQVGGNALFESSSNSGAAEQFMYGQYVTLGDGYNVKTFEFTPDVIAQAVIVGNIAIVIDQTPAEIGIRNSVDNLIDAIEANLHTDAFWDGSESTNDVPFIARVGGQQKICGTKGNTANTLYAVSQGITVNASGGTRNPFRDSLQRDAHNDFSGGTGSLTYSGQLNELPVKRGTVIIKVDTLSSGTPVYIQKGKDTKFDSFGNGGASTTSPHTSTDISPETTVTSGTVDYILGTWSITFTDPPWNGKAIQAVYNKPSKENVISLLGTTLLNDTDPPVSLTGYRNDNIAPYDIILDKIAEAVDTTDLEKPREWFVQIKEDDEKSNIVFVKRQSKDSADTIVLSYRDGIS